MRPIGIYDITYSTQYGPIQISIYHIIISENHRKSCPILSLIFIFIEASLEVKLPSYGQMQQQSWEESKKREQVETVFSNVL
jgi:hypothetical protein